MPKSRRHLRQEILEESLFSDEDECERSISATEDRIYSSICCNDTSQLRNLLDQGVNLDFTNRLGDCPLHVAVSQCLQNGDTEILDLLLFFGCPVNRQNRFGETPLHLASCRNPFFVECLLEAGAVVNAQDNAGRTALMLACGSHSVKALTIVQYLLDRGALVHYRDEDGQTALHYICKQYEGHVPVQTEIMYKLLYAGLDVNVTDHQGLSAAVYVYAINPAQSLRRPNHGYFNLLTPMIRGGSFIIHEQVNHFAGRVNHSLAVTIPRLISNIFTLIDFSIYEPVTSRQTCKKLFQVYKAACPGEVKTSAFSVYLKRTQTRESSLKELARLVIRERLNGKVLYNADKLGLPTCLEHYVTYSECGHVGNSPTSSQTRS